jgi:hypothetical protein
MAKGDHIYTSLWIEGNLITHHGIDCGDGTVIEYNGIKVVRIPKNKFGEGNTIHIKQYGQCDPPDIVMKNAESRLGEAKYHPLTNNCEHFASWCKTGLHNSQQAETVASGVSATFYTVTGVGTKIGTEAVHQATVQALNPIAKGLIKIGLQESPKVAGRAAMGIAGAGGLIPGVATDFVVGRILEDSEHLSKQERDARKAGRRAATLGSTVGGIAGTVAAGAVGGGAAISAAVAAPVVLGVAAAFGIYHLWKS